MAWAWSETVSTLRMVPAGSGKADTNKQTSALVELQEALGLDQAPARIECYDISNTQGSNAVGVMITSLEGDVVRNTMVTKLYNSAVRVLRLDGYNSVLDEALNPPNDGYGVRRRIYGYGTNRSI